MVLNPIKNKYCLRCFKKLKGWRKSSVPSNTVESRLLYVISCCGMDYWDDGDIIG